MDNQNDTSQKEKSSDPSAPLPLKTTDTASNITASPDIPDLSHILFNDEKKQSEDKKDESSTSEKPIHATYIDVTSPPSTLPQIGDDTLIIPAQEHDEKHEKQDQTDLVNNEEAETLEESMHTQEKIQTLDSSEKEFSTEESELRAPSFNEHKNSDFSKQAKEEASEKETAQRKEALKEFHPEPKIETQLPDDSHLLPAPHTLAHKSTFDKRIFYVGLVFYLLAMPIVGYLLFLYR